MKEIYNEEGLKGMTKGFNSCAIYYILAFSVTFLSYEFSRDLWSKYFENKS